jgi:tetratricopeptide (TPR) repeat protein
MTDASPSFDEGLRAKTPDAWSSSDREAIREVIEKSDPPLQIPRATQVIEFIQDHVDLGMEGMDEALSDFLLLRFELHSKEGRKDLALADLKRAATTWQSSELWLKVGAASGELNDYDEAIRAYTQVMEGGRGWKVVSALHGHWGSLFDKGDYEGALDDLTSLIETYGDPEGFLDRADTKIRLGNLAGALADYRSSLAKGSEGDRHQQLRSWFHTVAGVDLDQAARMPPGEISRVESEVIDWPCSLGWQLEMRGNVREALDHCTKQLEAHPGTTNLHEARARAYRKLGRLEEAVAEWSQVIDAKPFLAIPCERRGSLLYSLRRLPEALKDFDHALTISPTHRVRSRIYRALCHLWQGDNQSLVADLTEEADSYRSGCWTVVLCRFLLDRTKESEFLAWPATRDPETSREFTAQAYFVAGTRRWISGDTATASEYFRRSSESAPPHLFDRCPALEELRRLGQRS